MTIKELLQLTIEQNASDLHLISGIAPTVRVDGNLLAVPSMGILTPDMVAAHLKEVLTNEQLERLTVNKEKTPTPPCHIITIEDPVEFIFRPDKVIISQREMRADSHSWQVALRSVLREDPDVVLVGEMRDYETIASALTVAETGHL